MESFVKEKSLKAGDIVSFQRSTGPDRQLYIDYKQRSISVECTPVDVRAAGQMIRLFGVDICKLPISVAEVTVNVNGKRLREMELLAMESSSKKQMVVAAL